MATRTAQDYLYQGPFDRAAFRTKYIAAFQKRPKYGSASLDDLATLLGMIESDPKVTDIRWMAYMLATTFLESSRAVKVHVTSVNKKGVEQTRDIKQWQNYRPVEEVGHGSKKDYGKPVKVSRQADGGAIVTEWDGDQWTVTPSGTYRRRNKTAELGFKAPGQVKPTAPVDSYSQDTGDEYYYYGRGYVQLTWWSNYASAGEMLGRGLEFLLDPDLANEPKNAYQILSTGMRTGKAFANGKSFSRYFHDDVTNYAGARAMVNTKGAEEVAEYAKAFEEILFETRLGAKSAATGTVP